MIFKTLITRLKPANKNYNYMELKELSEIMEAAKAGATHHVMLYFKASKDYEAAWKKYMAQCQKPSASRNFRHEQA